jgi:hypothetical protein
LSFSLLIVAGVIGAGEAGGGAAVVGKTGVGVGVGAGVDVDVDGAVEGVSFGFGLGNSRECIGGSVARNVACTGARGDGALIG